MRSIIPWIAASILFSAFRTEAQESELDKILQGNIPASVRYIVSDSLSWTPPAKNQIIAARELKPVLPHAGFHPLAEKKAVLWTNTLSETGSFEIKDLTSGNIVYKDSLQSWGFHPWGGNNLLADFSALQIPGYYQLHIRLNNTARESFSDAFDIRFSVFQDLAANAFRWFLSQQCDAQTCPLHTRPDEDGGWHNDGFLNKEPPESLLSLFALSRHFTFLKTTSPALADSVRNMVIDQLGKLYDFAESSRPLYAVTAHKPDYIQTRNVIPVYAPILAAAAQLNISHYHLPVLRTISTECDQLDKAIKDQSFSAFARNHYIDSQSWLLQYAIARYQSTGQKKHLYLAESAVKLILAAQDTSGHFFSTPDHFWLSPDPALPFMALSSYFTLKEKLLYKKEIARAFRLYAIQLVRASLLSPMGHAGYTHTPLINSRTAGFNSWLLAFTYSLYKEDVFLNTAIHTFNWILGFNPADRSLLAGTGRDPGAYHHLASDIDGYPSGCRPGGVLNGFTGGLPGLTPLHEVTPPFDYVIGYKLPAIYPVLDTDTGKTSASLTNGYHTTNNAWFIMAAMLLDQLTAGIPVREKNFPQK